ncbi:hypothetical protein COV24_00210 [candidate division WWE3 bacterium CG10_big_fil_rev_8_21_14_0_10_32_10]|uniref:Uncharacterized protein n=1 Tax=candidate division WWE3 bacterium CG10_big_fil_rev_8_21_14_0_10_32_10 TaxID=1975090 RepID=A0A2H0RBQ2_UNCKA|nr:MAG: hypothetical protein COV24_00210 [candidate division WWE3 bacterium CG10_big_fil_rev_8_21_14_0_10_32_10]
MPWSEYEPYILPISDGKKVCSKGKTYCPHLASTLRLPSKCVCLVSVFFTRLNQDLYGNPIPHNVCPYLYSDDNEEELVNIP